MAEKDMFPLNPILMRGLNDKMYEKRKVAALEIERMVKEFIANNDVALIKRLTSVLTTEFSVSHNPHSRKGGLIGLAATAIALGKESVAYLQDLIPPVLSCFYDQDSRVRYYACEALYNISKVAKEAVLPFFNSIFDGLSKLASDTDPNVKSGADLLDRLVKDIVTESASFDIVSFIPLLRERMLTTNAFAKQFIVSWIIVLDSVPDLNMIDHLPEILDGIFMIFQDQSAHSAEIRKMCETALGEFLREIKKFPENVNFADMVNIIVVHSTSSDQLIQFTAVLWLREFLTLSGRTMIPFCANILSAVLPCVSLETCKFNTKEVATNVNQRVRDLITTDDDNEATSPERSMKNERMECDVESVEHNLDLGSVLTVLTAQLTSEYVLTRLAVLKWVMLFLEKTPNKLFKHMEKIFPVLLDRVSDTSDEVVIADLEVLSVISASQAGLPMSSELASPDRSANEYSSAKNINEYFYKFLLNLVAKFRVDGKLLEEKGHFIIRNLCLLLSSEDIYRTLAEILFQENDLKFAALMVKTLNIILLTSSELFELRHKLKELKTKESCELFSALYKSWCHNAVATFSLCLLTQTYQHGCDLLMMFGDLEVHVDFLVQIDKLVQLIESPIFTYLRLQLLDTQNNFYLLKSLYGLLMLLPQSDAFTTLRHRLDCVPNGHLLQTPQTKGKDIEKRECVKKIDFTALLQHFKVVQEKHVIQRHKKEPKTNGLEAT
ncbi:protein VAC14 homolog [Dendronephthya gigantea]|uniref:protein VAC14 homolog n=1 Tax=Dendronephthya gigantea TaxID=151771 RepID=UPI0010696A7F|nr:protein VAC14 homolog [Dendronephthya gigantea]